MNLFNDLFFVIGISLFLTLIYVIGAETHRRNKDIRKFKDEN